MVGEEKEQLKTIIKELQDSLDWYADNTVFKDEVDYLKAALQEIVAIAVEGLEFVPSSSSAYRMYNVAQNALRGVRRVR